ncbi:MAG: hypothetical protein ACXV3V_03860 [Actinomycetes bacterium]
MTDSYDPDDGSSDSPTSAGDGELSRRSLLASAGVAVAGGVALGAAAPLAPAEAAALARVAVGPRGTTVVEFSSRIAQTGDAGQAFTSYGFLTRVTGAATSHLFAGSSRTAGTALLTAFATGRLAARVIDQAVHSIDIKGTLTVYQRTTPGADFSNPASFAVGKPVARFAVTLLDVLTVFAPGQGLPTLTGDMHQARTAALSGGLAGKRFGLRGQRLRFHATGIGTLTDPTKLNSVHEIAGSWSAE